MDRALSDQFSLWVSKSANFLKNKAKNSRRKFRFDAMLVNNSVYCASPNNLEEAEMEAPVNEDQGICENELKSGHLSDLIEEESGESSSTSEFLASEVTLNCENSSSEDSSSSPSMGCPVRQDNVRHCSCSEVSDEVEKPHLDQRKLDKQGSSLSGTNCLIYVPLENIDSVSARVCVCVFLSVTTMYLLRLVTDYYHFR